MKLEKVFIGKWQHWVLWGIVAGVLWWLGSDSQHVRDFVPFTMKLLALTAVCVSVVVITYKPGDRITREPFEKEETK